MKKYALGDMVAASDYRKYGTWDQITSDGTASQKFYYQICTSYCKLNSQVVLVAGVAWTEVADLSSQSSAAQVYKFNDTTGEIIFGDEVHGKIPGSGVQVTGTYNHVHAGFQAYYDAMKAIDSTIKVFLCFDNIYSYVPSR